MLQWLAPRPSGPVEYLIVGLGNPGKKYEGTRHNAGFMALDVLAARCGAQVSRAKFHGLCGGAEVGGRRALLLKPATFMNLSGQSVCEAQAFYKIPPEKTILLSDDISLAPGRIRVRAKGSDGGHNGLKSIFGLAGSDAFPRVKIGVGAKPASWDLADWVLSAFTVQERALLGDALEHAADAVEWMVQGKISEAMNRYNQAPKASEKENPPS